MEDCNGNESYKKKVFVKKACFLDDDPYSFTKWEERSYILSGYVCMVGSCILSSQYQVSMWSWYEMQFCDKNFVFSGKAALQLVSEERITIPSIREAEVHLTALCELLQKADVQTIKDCCSVIHSVDDHL